jgi:hypothetical protein
MPNVFSRAFSNTVMIHAHELCVGRAAMSLMFAGTTGVTGRQTPEEYSVAFSGRCCTE